MIIYDEPLVIHIFWDHIACAVHHIEHPTRTDLSLYLKLWHIKLVIAKIKMPINDGSGVPQVIQASYILMHTSIAKVRCQ